MPQPNDDPNLFIMTYGLVIDGVGRALVEKIGWHLGWLPKLSNSE